ncbi:MAG: hypothetical protein AAB451_02410 [Patescibacteria group bacterium]
MKKIVDGKNEVRKHDWAFFAQSYFMVAKLACQELLDTRGNKHSKEGTSPYNPADLFVAILFNIKHGIEVYIKTIHQFVPGVGEYDEVHDIHQLFTRVKQKISTQKLSPQPQMFYDSITQKEIDELPEDLDKIELLVSYFYHLDLLKTKIGQNYEIKDVKNDVLRYPDNKAKLRIDWSTILIGRINISDIEQIFIESDKTSELLNKVGYLFERMSRDIPHSW